MLKTWYPRHQGRRYRVLAQGCSVAGARRGPQHAGGGTHRVCDGAGLETEGKMIIGARLQMNSSEAYAIRGHFYEGNGAQAGPCAW